MVICALMPPKSLSRASVFRAQDQAIQGLAKVIAAEVSQARLLRRCL